MWNLEVWRLLLNQSRFVSPEIARLEVVYDLHTSKFHTCKFPGEVIGCDIAEWSK